MKARTLMLVPLLIKPLKRSAFYQSQRINTQINDYDRIRIYKNIRIRWRLRIFSQRSDIAMQYYCIIPLLLCESFLSPNLLWSQHCQSVTLCLVIVILRDPNKTIYICLFHSKHCIVNSLSTINMCPNIYNLCHNYRTLISVPFSLCNQDWMSLVQVMFTKLVIAIDATNI